MGRCRSAGVCVWQELGQSLRLLSPVSPAGCWGAPVSPGSAHRGTRLARSPCDTQRGAGQRGEAEGSAGDCHLPFLICRGLGEKGWLWFLAVHNSQMSRLSGVFAQSSGCAALQYQAQKELLLFLEGRPNFLDGLPQSSQPQSQGSSASLGHHGKLFPLAAAPSVAPCLCWPRIFPRAVQSCHFGGGSLFPILLIATFMLPG